MVFKQGDPGDSFYVILDGSVAVYIGSSPDKRKSSVLPSSNSSTPRSSSDDELLLKRARLVTTLFKGTEFGQVALQTDSPRNATIKAISDTHLARLDRVDYLRIVKTHYDTQNAAISAFFKTIPVFKDWTDSKIGKVASMCILKRYSRGHIVASENQPLNEVYILKEGTFELKKLCGNRQDVLSVINPPQVMGLDEILAKNDKLFNSVVVTSPEAVVLELQASKITSRINPENLLTLQEEARLSLEFRKERYTILKSIHKKPKASNTESKACKIQQDWLIKLENLLQSINSEYCTPGRLNGIIEASGGVPVDAFELLSAKSQNHPRIP